MGRRKLTSNGVAPHNAGRRSSRSSIGQPTTSAFTVRPKLDVHPVWLTFRSEQLEAQYRAHVMVHAPPCERGICLMASIACLVYFLVVGGAGGYTLGGVEQSASGASTGLGACSALVFALLHVCSTCCNPRALNWCLCLLVVALFGLQDVRSSLVADTAHGALVALLDAGGQNGPAAADRAVLLSLSAAASAGVAVTWNLTAQAVLSLLRLPVPVMVFAACAADSALLILIGLRPADLLAAHWLGLAPLVLLASALLVYASYHAERIRRREWYWLGDAHQRAQQQRKKQKKEKAALEERLATQMMVGSVEVKTGMEKIHKVGRASRLSYSTAARGSGSRKKTHRGMQGDDG
jgi:hypothetical protein